MDYINQLILSFRGNASSSGLAGACLPDTFTPTLFGTEILDISANPIYHHSIFVPEIFRYADPAKDVQDISFCNVTVTYTHPGQGDRINVEAWLPIGKWNERMHTIGGGGWVAGRDDVSPFHMSAAVADAFVAVTTDAGLKSSFEGEPAPWLLMSPGNVDLFSLQRFGHGTLNETAIIGKGLAKDFYGSYPRYSYFTGCSNGGRQALMLAQRYPDAYDGIMAAAPGLNFTNLVSHLFWGNQVINNIGTVPHVCEIDTVSLAALAMCDGLDGVVDGIVSNVDECLATFDPFSVVGKTCQNGDEDRTVSRAAAEIAQAIWHGWTNEDGIPQFPGVSPSADITNRRRTSEGLVPLVSSQCNGSKCEAVLNVHAAPYFRCLAAKDASRDVSSLTLREFNDLSWIAKQQFASVVDATSTDLSRFSRAGGKMIAYHGFEDVLIPYKATENYYRNVAARDPSVGDYFRFYEVPGLSHCCLGASRQPTKLFSQLRAWVEDGIVPESSPVKVNALHGEIHDRIICPFPQKPALVDAGDPAKQASWECVGSWDL